MDQQDSLSGAGQSNTAAKQNTGPPGQAPNSRHNSSDSHQQSGPGYHNSSGHKKFFYQDTPRHRNGSDQRDEQRRYRNTPHEGQDWNSGDVRPGRHTPHEGQGFNSRVVHPSRGGNRGGPPPNKQQDGTAFARETVQHGDESFSSVEGQMSDLSLNVVKEKKCDLFTMPPEYSLAHCVGSDFIMSSGVAVKFRKKFRSIPKLLDQNISPGQVGFIKHEDQHVYYLVTKPTSTVKPNWEDFEKSVIEWKSLCVQHGVKQIAIPKIGCGRDHLDWGRVKNLLTQQFSGTGIEITVCIIEREATPEKKWNLKLCHDKHPLSELDPRECALIFLGSRDGFITQSIGNLAGKYGFEPDYKSKKLNVGDVYMFENKARRVNIFGFIVKDCYNDPVSYEAISKCCIQLRKIIKKSSLGYMGFEAFDDPKYTISTRKLWTVVIDVFFLENIEVHLCWPDNVKEKCWEHQVSGPR